MTTTPFPTTTAASRLRALARRLAAVLCTHDVERYIGDGRMECASCERIAWL